MRRLLERIRDLRVTLYVHECDDLGVPPNPQRIAEIQGAYSYMDANLADLYAGTREGRMAEAMGTGDFPFALGEFVNRMMVPAYEQRGFAFEPLVWNDTLTNYLTHTRYQRRSQVDDLEYVPPRAQPRPGSVDDAARRPYQVHDWAKIFEFDRHALVNDDLGYFNDMTMMMGRAARRSLEKFVSRLYTNASSIALLVALGALYSQTGRLTSTRISDARMAFLNRVDGRGEPLRAAAVYLVHHTGLTDLVAQIQNSMLRPEDGTNAANVIRSTFIPIEDPYMAGTAPDLPWYMFTRWQDDNVRPFVLARLQGMAGPMVVRRRSDIELVGSLLGAGRAAAPSLGSFMAGDIAYSVIDVWGTYVGDPAVDANFFDFNGAYYSSGTVA